jgi:hydroxypyruvate isomerase
MPTMTRREALAGGAAMIVASRQQAQTSPSATGRVVSKGRLKQSVCRWCYSKIPLPEFFTAVAGMGLTAVDLLSEKEWPIAREHGLICSMGSGAGGSIADGLNVKANHEKILAALTRAMPIAAAQKVPNLITFFGNRRGMGDPEAAANCIEGLNRIKPVAEEHGVTICVELLNSKVDHKDYQGDHSAFGIGIVKAVNSPRVKLLYDIYHMQIMGRRLDPYHQGQQGVLRALSHGRCPWTARAGRYPGGQLEDSRHRDRRNRIPGILRTRVHPGARSADVAPGSGGTL